MSWDIKIKAEVECYEGKYQLIILDENGENVIIPHLINEDMVQNRESIKAFVDQVGKSITATFTKKGIEQRVSSGEITEQEAMAEIQR